MDSKDKKQLRRDRKQLFEAIASLKTSGEVEKFLVDLCTPKELEAMSERWLVATLLKEQIPYRKIYEQTGVSTATVTRVARCLSDGAGGYELILERRGLEQ